MSGVWQQIEGTHAKTASMPCCCAADRIAARQLSLWVVASADPFAFEVFLANTIQANFD